MERILLTVSISYEQDVVLCRQRARQIAALLGFELQEQTRVATAVSEIARNAFRYAVSGKATFSVTDSPTLSFQIRIQDRGKGIQNLDEILTGRHESKNGMGLGISGSRRLMDSFSIESSPDTGTLVVLRKNIPFRKEQFRPDEIALLAGELAKTIPNDAFSELRQQNAELAQAMRILQEREEELTTQRNSLHILNEELANTNRGVVALNKELEERAEAIKYAGEIKSRFLSHMTHEFRTPLNSILSLTRILLSTCDSDELSLERQKQIMFVRKSAEQLSEMINDMLDTAKLEAGRVEVQPGDVEVAELFGSLRAMFRPLLRPEHPVELIFEIDESIPLLYSDEGKIAQILRNFISNALKFTVEGEVRVKARLASDDFVEFSVIDTGIGISLKDQDRIFQEFTQLDGPMQRLSKGTGLGLPLARRLSELLGGQVSVQSEPGVGSTFAVLLPVRCSQLLSVAERQVSGGVSRPTPNSQPVNSFVTTPHNMPDSTPASYMDKETFQSIASRSLARARLAFQNLSKSASALDTAFSLNVEPGLSTESTPIIVISLMSGERTERSSDTRLSIKPNDQIWFLKKLHDIVGEIRPNRVLIIDDDEISRYILVDLLKDSSCTILEAKGGKEGLQRASEDQPQVIFLDLRMPDMSGFEVLAALKNNPDTKDIPVIVNSSVRVAPADFVALEGQPIAILSKELPQDMAAERIQEALRHAGLIGLDLTGEQGI
ncbi:MAG TPA: ATP-binding protein [Oligoflexus sp.]|uniref:ATP-binding protein n=1 Tax=Oligoflexus sp. TaxID=1971216 RepID=UPI002D37190A|nr:ATP-binding protein [Oligoflexus sp.]HYX37743.1 ATP-binding protein [Oligoflexus sp.]